MALLNKNQTPLIQSSGLVGPGQTQQSNRFAKGPSQTNPGPVPTSSLHEANLPRNGSQVSKVKQPSNAVLVAPGNSSGASSKFGSLSNQSPLTTKSRA